MRYGRLFRRAPSINPHTREEIYRRDKHRCVYCNRQFPRKTLTLDHITPRVDGGKDGKSNLATCCLDCNRRKGRMSAEEFRELLTKDPKPE